MAMWAGVQNVSRPMERCHDMSQCVPTMAEVTATTAHHTYQGIAERTDPGSGAEAAKLFSDMQIIR